jgi:membrane protease YdiL (CAAX protease family)
MNAPNNDITRDTGSKAVWPLIMAFIRTPLALIGYGLAIYFFRPNGTMVGAGAGVIWAAVSISVVNVVSLALLIWRFHVEDLSIADVIGIRKGKVLTDVGFGLLWSFLLYCLLVIGMVFSVLCLRGAEGFAKFDNFLLGPNPDFSFRVPFFVTVVSAVVFPLLNPIVEELNYRGYSQLRLESLFGRPGVAILISSIGFGLQHIAFAMTVESAIAFTAAFFLWGLGAGFIVHKQRRLFPVMVAHFISNLIFGLAPLFFIATQ